MKTLIAATLALALSAAAVAAAQNQNDPAPAKPASETSSGKPLNATSHTYQKGERLSLAHGRFDEVADWKGHHLTMPEDGDHWVYYGDNYLLARIDTGIILDIVKASWGAGRG